MALSPLVLPAVVMGLLLVVIALYVEWVGTERERPTPGIGSGRYGGPEGEGGGGEQATAAPHKPGGLTRWLTTVDHKDIGILYGVFAILAFVWGGLGIVLMRTELTTPTLSILDANLYNSLLTTHGITLLFLFGTPIIAAFANYFVPLLIGADDMAFPRINAIAFWLLPPGALLIWGGFFIPSIAPSQTSWTMYTPLSACGPAVVADGASCLAQVSAGVDLMLLGLHLTGVSATMGAINFIVTIVAERGDDVDWATLDIFSWTMLTQSGIILFAFPLLGSALVMLLLDRNFGTTFYAVEGGGPILWQHLFWFFGHPEVYILVLPPMGLISYILPRFSGRRLFGFKFVVYSTLAIGVLSFGVWAHHMFSTTMDPELAISFMAVSLAIAIPSAVKTFNWITTMWNGRLRLTASMLFCIGFVSNFIIGGVTGVFLAAVPVDLVLQDTYYVVGHFHYIVMGAIGFAVFAGIYYWFPILTGRMYQRTLAKWHFWLSMVGTNLTFFAMLFLGYLGMPRRYAAYDVPVGPLGQFVTLHRAATAGTLLLLVGQMIFVWNLVSSWREGRRSARTPGTTGNEPLACSDGSTTGTQDGSKPLSPTAGTTTGPTRPTSDRTAPGPWEIRSHLPVGHASANMETTPAVRGLRCRACSDTFDVGAATRRCPSCDGFLTVSYETDAITTSGAALSPPGSRGLGRYGHLLPFDGETLVSMDEGSTPLVECPGLADDLGVAELYVKDEGCNPTGSVRDRGLALAVTAAREHGAGSVTLPTTGAGGQAAAAYAARAGLESHAFVPSRAPFAYKALTNVHGGEMSVVGGRYGDAVDAFEAADHDADDHSVAPFETPYRLEGQKTLAFELSERLDGTLPDAVVTPTGHGLTLAGLYEGSALLCDLGLADSMPALYAAQAADCAPIVDAHETGRETPDPWDHSDTICGSIEVADPAGGRFVLEAIHETGGGAVASADADSLEVAVTVAQSAGVDLAPATGVAASGAQTLADQGHLGADDTVVVVNTATGNVEADVLRSHLMSKGV